MKTVLVGLSVVVAMASACTDAAKATKDSASTTESAVGMPAQSRPTLDAGESMQSVITGNVWVRVRGFGDGVPAVLVPGAPGTGSYLLKGFEAIGEDRNVVRYDLLGTGRSDPLPEAEVVSPLRAADDLESLRRAMKIDRWSVVGHSYGAATALMYAKARPRETLGVVLINPQFSADTEGPRRMPLLSSADSAMFAADLDSMRTMPGGAVDASIRRTVGDSAAGGLSLGEAATVLKKWKIPTLVVVGENDVEGLKGAKALAKALRGAKLTVLPKVGAFAPIEARDATRDVVRTFLKSIEPRPTVRTFEKAGPRTSRD